VPEKFNDIAAVIATRDYAAARPWYSRLIGCERAAQISELTSEGIATGELEA
jgi:hypothetical protein